MKTSLFVEEGHTAPEWVCGSHLDESRACYALERLLAARGLLEVRLPASYKRTQEETLK
jgi:hypothetical protein